MKGVGSAKNWCRRYFSYLASIVTSGYIWPESPAWLTFFVAYMLVLTWAGTATFSPASSFSYAVVAMLGISYWEKPWPRCAWIGIICYLASASLLSAYASAKARRRLKRARVFILFNHLLAAGNRRRALCFRAMKGGREVPRLPAGRARSFCFPSLCAWLDVGLVSRFDDAGLFSLLAMLSIGEREFRRSRDGLELCGGPFGAMLFLARNASARSAGSRLIVCIE